jgi:hypothetical protein
MMTPSELPSCNVESARGAAGTETSPASKARAHLRRSAAFVTAGMLTASVLTAPGYCQVGGAAGPAAANRGQIPAAVTADTLSCKQLKDSLQSAGTLTIISGQKAWGETFYGPGVPQCEFWSRPMFEFVTASDGPCGVGYVCAQRVTGGR